MREYYKMAAQQKNKKSPVPTIIGATIAALLLGGIVFMAARQKNNVQ